MACVPEQFSTPGRTGVMRVVLGLYIHPSPRDSRFARRLCYESRIVTIFRYTSDLVWQGLEGVGEQIEQLLSRLRS